MWVVWVLETGWSDESMRFATYKEANDYINERTMPWNFAKRWESDEPALNNHVALGQINVGGGWEDYGRDTPENTIRWAKARERGTARVVDWISRDVMWP